jgi:hypothetical protein
VKALDIIGENINISPDKKLFVVWDYTGWVCIFNVSSITPIE